MRFGCAAYFGVLNGTSTSAGIIVGVMRVYRIGGAQIGFNLLAYIGMTCGTIFVADAATPSDPLGGATVCGILRVVLLWGILGGTLVLVAGGTCIFSAGGTGVRSAGGVVALEKISTSVRSVASCFSAIGGKVVAGCGYSSTAVS